MSQDIDVNKLVMLLAERLRERASIQGRVPFKTGMLRKSIYAQLIGRGRAAVGSNLPYARAVHDGRKALTIRPRTKKALFWPGAKHPVKAVRQKARKGKPFLREAAQEMNRQGYDFLQKPARDQVAARLQEVLSTIKPPQIILNI